MRLHSHSVLVPLALAALATTRLAAQSLAEVPIGSRVRVTLADSTAQKSVEGRRAAILGTLLGRSGDSLVIGVPGIPSPFVVPMAAARTVAVSRGAPSRVSSALRDGLDWAIAGAAVGNAVGTGPGRDSERGTTRAIVKGAVIGLFGGALAGAISPTERWRVVHRSDPRSPLRPTPASVAVGYSATTLEALSGQGPTVEAALPIGRLRGRIQPRAEALYHRAQMDGWPGTCEQVAPSVCTGRSDDVTMFGASLSVAIVDRGRTDRLRWYLVPLGVGAYRIERVSTEAQADARTCIVDGQIAVCPGSLPFGVFTDRVGETVLGLSGGAGMGLRIGGLEPTLGVRALLGSPGRGSGATSVRVSLGLLL